MIVIISPSQAHDLRRYPTYEEVVAWAIEDGLTPPTPEEYDADKEATAKLKPKIGTLRGMTFINDG